MYFAVAAEGAGESSVVFDTTVTVGHASRVEMSHDAVRARWNCNVCLWQRGH